jgi:hypothetical protein
MAPLSDGLAEEGHVWALKHYSPVPTARRFAAIAAEQLN